MALQNILPSYQAEEKSAQIQLHPVRMPSNLDGIGQMLTDAGQGLQKAGAGLALSFKRRHDELQAREDNLMLTEKTNGFTAEAAKAFQELERQKGKEASGSTQKYSDTLDKLMNSFGAGMNPKNSRIFRMNAARIANSYLLRMMDHEDSNIRQADIEATEHGISILSDKYAEDQNYEDFLDGVKPLYLQWYVATYGGMPSEEGLEQYNAGFDNILELAKGKAFDALLKKGDIAEAEKYFNKVKDDVKPGTRMNMENRLKDQSKGLEVNAKAQSYLGQINLAHDVSDGKYDMSNGGRYLTQAQADEFARIDYELAMSKDPDAADVRRQLHQMYQAQVNMQKANLGQDLAETVSGLFQDNSLAGLGRDIIELKRRYDAMSPSVLKDEVKNLMDGMEKTYAKEYATQWNSYVKAVTEREKAEKEYNDNLAKQYKKEQDALINDPYRQALASAVMLEANHVATKDGRLSMMGFTVNLHDKNQREMFFAMASIKNQAEPGFLTDDDIRRIRDIAEGRVPAGLRTDAATEIATLMNQLSNKNEKSEDPSGLWDQGRVSCVMPHLVNEYMDFSYSISQDGKASADAIKKAKKTFLLNRLAEMRTQKNSILWGLATWGENHVNMLDFYNNALRSDGLINVEQLEDEWRKLPRSEYNTSTIFTKDQMLYNALYGNDDVGYRDVTRPRLGD